MDKYVNIRSAKIMSYVVAASFLLVHVAMFFLFRYFEVMPMMYFNIFSMTFYACMMVCIHKEWLRLFVVGTYFEVVAHMVAAVCCVGWDSGFQVTLVGMNVLAFFSEYMGKSMDSEMPALPLGIVALCAYLSSFMISSFYGSPYSLPHEVEFWLQIVWGIVTFGINGLYLQIFVLLTFNSERDLTSLAAHDTLTGLPNRNYMTKRLAELAIHESTSMQSWIAIADIDDFKRINDAYGHNCGDYVLKTVAAILSEEKSDAVVCRWGGEEFLLLGTTGEDYATSCAQLDRIRKTVEGYKFWYGENKMSITITIGVAPFDPDLSTNEWINKADGRLYEGKRSGKNCVVGY